MKHFFEMRLALKELKNRPLFTLLTCATVSLGLVGLTLVESYRDSLMSMLQQQSREMLAADLSIRARRLLTPHEIQTAYDFLKPHLQSSDLKKDTHHVVEMFSMVSTPAGSRLVQVRAVAPTFPFYGTLELGSGPLVAGIKSLDGDRAWVAPELLTQLNLKPGSQLHLGATLITIDDTVKKDVATSIGRGSIAPRVYISAATFEKTKLLQPGSTFFSRHLFRLKPETNLEMVEQELNTLLPDPAVRIEGHMKSSEQTARSFGVFSDYLGLTGTIALILSCIGLAYLLNSFIRGKLKDSAVLICLGLLPSSIVFILFIQITLLGILAALTSIGISALILPAINYLLVTFTEVDVLVHLSTKTMITILFLSVISSILIAVAVVGRIPKIQPKILFQEGLESQTPRSTRALLWFTPGILFFYFFSIYQAHSWKVGSIFFASCLVSVLAAVVTMRALLKKLSAYHPRGTVMRMGHQYITRFPAASIASFIALALGSLLLNVMIQTQHSLNRELNPDISTDPHPSLFLFDIQEEQREPLEKLLASHDLKINAISPWIRARLEAINGKAFEKMSEDEMRENANMRTREDEQEERFRNRGMNVTIREKISSSERIIQGEDFSGPHDPNSSNPPLISLEERFADRLNINMGDTLRFDIQGVSVEGKVSSFRRVRWLSFQPNFFIQFQPGAIDDAPKTYVAILPPLTPDQKNKVQNEIVRTFGNISMVDVSSALEKITAITSQMGLAVQLLGLLVLCSGALVLYSVASHQIRVRQRDLNLMKILGARFSELLLGVCIEFASFGLAAGLFGSTLGWVMSLALGHYLFDALIAPAFFIPILLTVALVLLSALVSVGASLRRLRQKPALVMQATAF